MPRKKAEGEPEEKKPVAKTKQFIGFTPHPGQVRIIDAVLNSNHKYYTLCMGRSWGKTQMCINLMLMWAINEKNSDILYISPTFKLAREVYLQICEAVKDSGVIANNNKTNLELTFITGSKMRFGSGERPNTHRGLNTLTHAVIDEMSFQHPDLFKRVIQSCLLARGKKCLMISTPNGYDHFWDEFQKGIVPDPDFISYKAPSHENPYIDFDEMEFYKKNNPILYKVEYLAEFVDEYTGVFSNVKECVYGEIEDIPNPAGGMYSMGLDLGRRDATVVTILDLKQNKVVDLLRLQDREWDDVLYEVAQMYHKWKPIHGYAECNFNDRIIEELVKDRGCITLRPFYTMSHTKQPMIENLILQFSQKLIKIPNHPQLIKELRAYSIRFKRGSSKPTYSGGAINDDMVISLALASQSRKDKYKQGSNLLWEPI